MRYLLRFPHFFDFNAQTAVDNEFQQKKPELNSTSIRISVRKEFEGVLELLRSKQIEFVVMDAELPTTDSPDAIFPNNWFSTHENGQFFTYPMKSINRRTEVNAAFIRSLGYQYHIALETEVENKRFLEGTGSMVFDRTNKIVYASRSERTSEFLVDQVAERLGYETFVFDAFSLNGKAIYHTNVVMHTTAKYLCIASSLLPEGDRKRLTEHAQHYDKRIIELSAEQSLKAFAGNMLQLTNRQGKRFLALSKSAYHSLNPSQIEQLEAEHATLLPFHIPTIEAIGGGSIRCMIAELV